MYFFLNNTLQIGSKLTKVKSVDGIWEEGVHFMVLLCEKRGEKKICGQYWNVSKGRRGVICPIFDLEKDHGNQSESPFVENTFLEIIENFKTGRV